jgi:hypothetical protein
MARFAKQDVAPRQDGYGGEWRAELNGYAVSFVAADADLDLTDLLRGLPNDQCPCPHWGYVIKGSIWFRYGDREEVIGAGDAFSTMPGHTAGAREGTEFVIFSPAEVSASVEAHVAARAKLLFGSEG